MSEHRLAAAYDVEGARRFMYEAALAPEPYEIPPMPEEPGKQRAWMRKLQDAFNAKRITQGQLQEARKTLGALDASRRASAEVLKARAAEETAAAATKTAEALERYEYGGPAVAMLELLRNGKPAKALAERAGE